MKDKIDHIRLTTTTQSNAEQPALLQQVKNSAQSILTHCLENLFNSCDDLFFDLSSRATSNSEQNLYFESMRELRIKKSGALNNFFIRINDDFNNAAQAQVAKPLKTETKPDNLSLVHDDDIERDVAISSMVNKARHNNQESLYHLLIRMDSLLGKQTLNQQNNPLDPQQLCNNFADACELFDIHIKAKIIIYKQFERLVISHLGKVYATANDLLINAGVIPNINHQIIKNTNNSQHKSEPQKAENTSDQITTDATTNNQAASQYSELSQLLSNIRSSGGGQATGYTQYSHNPGPTMSNYDLLSALSSIPATDAAFNANTASNNLHMLIDLILSKANPNTPQSVHQSDEDTINLVAMFFDFILDDQNLPATFQAIISRYQIPVLKIALKDREFFKNGSHPVRKLINTIAAAAIGWESNDADNDKLYQLINQITQEIIENYNNNENIFNIKQIELDVAIKQNEHRRSLIEKRTNQAAQGKAITHTAKALSQKTLLESLKKATLPSEISQFLIDHWQSFMVSTFIKHGKDSPEWLDATQLIHDLLWACNTQAEPKAIARLEKIKPALMSRIENGLSHVIHDNEQRITYCEKIDNLIEKLQKNRAALTIRPISPAQAQSLGHTPGGGTKDWKEMTALERQQAQHQALTYEHIKIAEALAIDTWLDYDIISEQKTIRCKLASRIEANDSYIFVNRFGFNVLEKNRKDFAYDLQQKRAKPLEAAPLFDRAFNRIAGNLRNLGQNNTEQVNK